MADDSVGADERKIAVGFRATLSSNQSLSGSGSHPVQLDQTDFDYGGDFNITSHEFIVPVSGLYLISGSVYFDSTSDGGNYSVFIRINGSDTLTNRMRSGGGSAVTNHVSTIFEFSEGDAVDMTANRTSSTTTDLRSSSEGTFMAGYLITST